MRVIVAYESMYGSTHRVADAIAAGFDPRDDVNVVPVGELTTDDLEADLVIIGAPTHAHGLPRPASRRSAIDSAQTRYEHHTLDPSVSAAGVREWLKATSGTITATVATYDTRFRWPGWLVGHPASRVQRTLLRRGGQFVDRPESFFVDKHEQLRPGELDRARQWGGQLRAKAAPLHTHVHR